MMMMKKERIICHECIGLWCFISQSGSVAKESPRSSKVTKNRRILCGCFVASGFNFMILILMEYSDSPIDI